MMERKVKNFKNEIEILLVILTFLSLIMSTIRIYKYDL